jgi:uncharacterized membrane protein
VVTWLRRSFLTGLFVTVPVVVSLAACVWLFRTVDGLVGPYWQRWIGVQVPGLGLLTTAVLILGVGVVAGNVLGKRALKQADTLLERVPLFGTIYAPVKQMAAAFAPGNEAGFKRVVLVEDPRRGWILGFLTREFSVESARGDEAYVAVFVPTNHLYLGDVLIVPASAARYPDLTVEEGVRVVLTGGMALPARLREPGGVGPGGAEAGGVRAWDLSTKG